MSEEELTVEVIEEPKDKIKSYSWVVITIFIINLLLLAYLAGLVLKNRDKAELDPLAYGAKVYDISSCSCQTNSNEFFFYNSTAVWITVNNPKQMPTKQLNYSEFDKLLRG